MKTLLPAIALALISSLHPVHATRPNVIFLMDDQHRWDALGLVDPAVQTPTLDALAKEGIFFDQAVCQAPMCIPSRNSMMLGLYPNQIGILTGLWEQRANRSAGRKTSLDALAPAVQGRRLPDGRFRQDALGDCLFDPWIRDPLCRRVSRRWRDHDEG